MSLLARTLRRALGQGSLDHTALKDEISRLRGVYLQLVKDCLIGASYRDPGIDPGKIAEAPAFRPELREAGLDWPMTAQSMIGNLRMLNLWQTCEEVIARGVPGDFNETGVWRGGACIFMRAILKTYGVTDRTVWVADSFEGLPPPDEEKYPADRGLFFNTIQHLAVSLEEVQDNFRVYGLLDDQVKFLKGWFKDTLPVAPIERLAVLRLDGDLYESTMDALRALYHKVSPGGYTIIDDYSINACRQAVTDFRRDNAIGEPIRTIDRTAVFWQRTPA